ncbi:MAG: hypothetical protein GY725_00200 [bacterium]|nr:hypothetical protein [bacterium]
MRRSLRSIAKLLILLLFPVGASAGTIQVQSLHEPGTNFVHLSILPSQDLVHFNLHVSGAIDFDAPVGFPEGNLLPHWRPGTAIAFGSFAGLPSVRSDVPPGVTQFGGVFGLHPNHELFVFPGRGFLEIPMAIGGQETYLGRLTLAQDPMTDPDFAIYSICDLGSPRYCGLFTDGSDLLAGDLIGDISAPPDGWILPSSFTDPNEPAITEPDEPAITEPDEPAITEPDEPAIPASPFPEINPPPTANISQPIPEPGSALLFLLGGAIVLGAVGRSSN